MCRVIKNSHIYFWLSLLQCVGYEGTLERQKWLRLHKRSCSHERNANGNGVIWFKLRAVYVRFDFGKFTGFVVHRFCNASTSESSVSIRVRPIRLISHFLHETQTKEKKYTMSSNTWFFSASYEMLSSYVLTRCPTVDNPHSFWTGAMILASYLPFMNYVVMTFNSVYKRNGFFFVNAQGALFCDFLVWAVQSISTPTAIETVLCNNRAVFTISSLSALCVYFSTFYLIEQVINLQQVLKTNLQSFLSLCLVTCYIVNLVFGCYSHVYLHLSTAAEVATGAAIGCVSSIIFTLLLILIVQPRGNKEPLPLTQCLLNLCCVEHVSYSNK